MTRNHNICALENKSLYFGPRLVKDNPVLENWQDKRGSSFLIANNTDIVELLEIEKKTNPHGIMHKTFAFRAVPLYLYYDTPNFERLISEKDITRLCEIYRIVWIIGKENLRKFFSRSDVIFPNFIIEDDDKKNITTFMHIMLENRKREYDSRKLSLIKYYQENAENIKTKIENNTAKFLFPRYTYEPTRFKAFYDIVKIQLENLGYQVVINMEDDTIYNKSEVDLLYIERPDAVFLINKFRTGEIWSGELFRAEEFDGLYYINWLQDRIASAFSKFFPQKLRKRDVLFSLFDFNYLKQFGYKKNNIIDNGIQMVSDTVFKQRGLSKEDLEKYECDICFAGLVMTSEQMFAHIYHLLQGQINENDIIIVLEKAIDLVENIYDADSGNYIIQENMLYNIRDELHEKIRCSEQVSSIIFRTLIDIRYLSLRSLILQQLASTNKYKIYYYGESDIKIPGIIYRGYLSDEKELSKAFQASKVSLSICPNATMSQRIIETLLSGGLALVYKMPDDEDVCNCNKYLKEGEGICYFRNKNELIKQLDYLINDKKSRENIIEKGQTRILETLTAENIIKNMILELKSLIHST